tara:strand:+ start:17116 stop:17244 length:129 start_codon:yes stop_codon:yes gene_type:complete
MFVINCFWKKTGDAMNELSNGLIAQLGASDKALVLRHVKKFR